ncbi:MAG: hypothetical protein AB7S75_19960 [Desulfococcaceae bacterium]
MESLRITQKPVKHKITVTLPPSFGEDEVEVIILPIGKRTGKKSDLTSYRPFMKHTDMNREEKIRTMGEEQETKPGTGNRIAPHPVMSRINIKYDPTEALDQNEWPEAS